MSDHYYDEQEHSPHGNKTTTTMTGSNLHNHHNDEQEEENEDHQQTYHVNDFPNVKAFEMSRTYPAIRVPVRRTAAIRKTLKHVLLKRRRTSPVHIDPIDPQHYRILVLDDDINNKDEEEEEEGKESRIWQDVKVQEVLQQQQQKQSTKKDDDDDDGGQEEVQRTTYTLKRGYEDLSVEEVLRQILLLPHKKQPDEPDGRGGATTTATTAAVEIPSSFETVGSLAHINLREEWLPYRYWIGKVILDKHRPQLRTVVRKVGTIDDGGDNAFRTFAMQVLATDETDPTKNWSLVTVKEEGYSFVLDFRQVYWNSRLSKEHQRIVRLIRNEAKTALATGSKKNVDKDRRLVVADLMAGVGPFAIPLTASSSSSSSSSKKQKPNKDDAQNCLLTVYANDLNPASYKYLIQNAEKNSCRNLHCFNMDGRALVHRLQKDGIRVDHVIMNLPASAPECLDAFRGYRIHNPNHGRPRLHVHCFAPKYLIATSAEQQQQQEHKCRGAAEDAAALFDQYRCAVDRCAVALYGRPAATLDRVRDEVRIHVVRDVAPKKNMLCVSFRLPADVQDLEPLSIPEQPSQADCESNNATTARKDNSPSVQETTSLPESKRARTK